MNYIQNSPEILVDFLNYMQAIKGRSEKTVNEYFLDLRNFLRYQKMIKTETDRPLREISINDIDITFIKSITLSDIYSYLTYLAREREVRQNSKNTDYGISGLSRSRKASAIRSFYKYLHEKAGLLDENLAARLDMPKSRKKLAKHLTLDESVNLLKNINSDKNTQRDHCIITIFLNCGLRVSELVGINLDDIRQDYIRVLGKGDKERIVYINQACKNAIDEYLQMRPKEGLADPRAMFISRKSKRISASTVKWLVKKHLANAGLDTKALSTHKLRHTAATLMYQNGVDLRTLQEILGHENLNTTQIYTHIDNKSKKEAADKNPLSDL